MADMDTYVVVCTKFRGRHTGQELELTPEDAERPLRIGAVRKVETPKAAPVHRTAPAARPRPRGTKK